MPSSPRSLADDLRQRSGEDLVRLLESRTDLARPIPPDFGELARRVNSSESVLAALSGLSATDAGVLAGYCALASDHKLSVSVVASGLASPDTQVQAATDRLHALALLWGPPSDLRIPSAVREAAGPYPCGLDPVVRPFQGGRTPQQLASELADTTTFVTAPTGTHELLRDLVWHSPTLTILGTSPPLPAIWLHERGFLRAVGEASYVLPREVSLEIRHGSLLSTPLPVEPTLTAGTQWPRERVQESAGHAADFFVRTVDRIVSSLTAEGLPLLSKGGLVARDWRRRAERLRIPPEDLALILELAQAAGWLEQTGSQLRTSPHYPHEAAREDLWVILANTWLTLPRIPWRPAASAATSEASPLSPGLADYDVPRLRNDLLTALTKSSGSLDAAAVLPWLLWRRPQRQPSAQQVNELLGQASLLGLTGLGALSDIGNGLIAGQSIPALAAALAQTLPEVSDKLVLQADLTATATFPLTLAAQRRLEGCADFESGGGATVYRFTAESLARAMAAGERADAVIQWLEDETASALPVALRVLIEDVQRNQAIVAVSDATAVMQTNAELVDRLVQDASLQELGLRRVADTVVTAAVSGEALAQRLRALGYSTSWQPQETASHNQDIAAQEQPALGTDQERAGRIVAALLKTEGPVPQSAPRPPETSTATYETTALLAKLAQSRDDAHPVWLSYSDADGLVATRQVDVIEIDSGQVTALTRDTNAIVQIAVARLLTAAS